MNWKDRLEQLMEDANDMQPLRSCSICSVNIGYKVIDGLLAFDSGCGCSDGENLRLATLFEFRDACQPTQSVDKE